MTDITPIEAVQKIIDEGGNGYEAALALAMSAEGDMSQRRFLLGDLALLIKSAYGKNRILDFATKAGIARSTMSQYKNVAAFYEPDTRYLFDNLSYAHFRCAMRLKERAFSFLEDCSANSYTVEQAQIEVTKILGKPLPPLKLLDALGCIQSVDLTNGLLVIALAPGVDGLQLEGLVNQTVNVKIFETSEDN
jgi:hypothetical protein